MSDILDLKVKNVSQTRNEMKEGLSGVDADVDTDASLSQVQSLRMFLTGRMSTSTFTVFIINT